MKKNSTAILLPLLALCAILCGCASQAVFTPLHEGGPYGAEKSPDEIALFITKRPDFKYRELGIISFSSNSGANNDPFVYEKMKEKAAEIGADGIIIMDSQSTFYQDANTYYDLYGNIITGDTTRSYINNRGMAIKRTE